MFRNALAEALGVIPRHHWHPKISLHLQAFNVMMAEFPDIAQLDDGMWDAVIVTGSRTYAQRLSLYSPLSFDPLTYTDSRICNGGERLVDGCAN